MGHLLTTDETTEIIMHQANELNIMTEATMTNTIDNRVWIWMRNVENQNTPVHNKTKSEKGTSLCVKKRKKERLHPPSVLQKHQNFQKCDNVRKCT